MKKTLLTIFIMLQCGICFAMPPTDKTAHFGVGYIVNDQLKKNTNLTFCERIAIVSIIAYAKEKSDSYFDKKDLFATVLGGLTIEIKF